MSKFEQAVLLAQFASTWFMVGVIWFVQVVHYPLFGCVGADYFRHYESLHVQRTTWVVLPAMIIELATAVLLIWARPLTISPLAASASLGLLALIWLSTFAVQVDCHKKIASEFDAKIHQRLVRSNWLRTLSWSLRGLLVLGMMHGLIES